MITGETVTVLTPTEGEADPFGETSKTLIATTVENVLVQPGANSDLTDSNRPNGETVVMTLHFPKSFTQKMRGCKVTVRGDAYSVVGDPQPYTIDNTPTKWNYPVEVTRTDG